MKLDGQKMWKCSSCCDAISFAHSSMQNEYAVFTQYKYQSHPWIRRTQTSTFIFWYWVEKKRNTHTHVQDTPLLLVLIFLDKKVQNTGRYGIQNLEPRVPPREHFRFCCVLRARDLNP